MGRGRQGKRKALAVQQRSVPPANKGNDQQESADQTHQGAFPVLESKNQQVRAYAADDNPASQKPRNYERAIARWTCAVGLFTGALVLANGYSAYVLHSTDEKIRESYVAVQRPFVTAKELVVDKNIIPGYWSFGIRFQNSGSTPTQGMEFIAIADPRVPDDPEPSFQNPPVPVSRFPGLLGPKADDLLQGTGTGLPVAVIDKMADTRSSYYFRGVIKYRDVFKETEEHTTKYCFVFIPYKVSGDLKFGVQRCLYWNCADEECKKDKERYEAALKEANKRQTLPPQSK